MAIRALMALAASVALGASAPAIAATQRYAVDGAQSWVDFKVRYLGLFSLGGRFRAVTGDLAVDLDDARELVVTMAIPVSTLESKPAFWRSELLSPRFFDAAHHPEIRFAAERSESEAGDARRCFGTLTLRGTSRPVVLDARLRRAAGSLEVEASALVSRAAFGLGGVLPFASDDVTISLHLVARPTPSP
ncbi:MAG: YceI family protein [Proteobacteria bacterium]|nr:YceI family protein [Pseudomonadota bacterium]